MTNRPETVADWARYVVGLQVSISNAPAHLRDEVIDHICGHVKGEHFVPPPPSLEKISPRAERWAAMLFAGEVRPGELAVSALSEDEKVQALEQYDAMQEELDGL